MKRLQEFINEQVAVNEAENKTATVTFDFTDLENAEDTLKSLAEQEGCSVEENTLTVTIDIDNADKLGTVQDILQQYAEILRNSSKNSSDEQYAQKTNVFAKRLGEFNDILDEIQNSEEE